MSFSAVERQRLSELMLSVGPHHPTLCEGWDTYDLACHLYLREHNIVAAAGMFVPALSGRTDDAMHKLKGQGFEEVVKRWAGGPSTISPMYWLDAQVNMAEHFIHHEDVRRGVEGAQGQGQPREFSRAVEAQLLKVLKLIGTMQLRKSPVPVIFTPTGFTPITCGSKAGVVDKGDDVLRVCGAPGELLLWLYGREEVEVEIIGDASRINRGV